MSEKRILVIAVESCSKKLPLSAVSGGVQSPLVPQVGNVPTSSGNIFPFTPTNHKRAKMTDFPAETFRRLILSRQ